MKKTRIAIISVLALAICCGTGINALTANASTENNNVYITQTDEPSTTTQQVIDSQSEEVQLPTIEEHNNTIQQMNFEDINTKTQNGIQAYQDGQTNMVAEPEYSTITIDEQKSFIYHKMLNSVDYFSTAEGTIISTSIGLIDNPTTIQYQLDNSTSSGYYIQKDEINSYNLEGYTINNTTTEINNINKTYTSYNTQCDDFVLSDNDRLMKNENGELVSIYRPGAEATGMAKSLSLFAQGLAFNFLFDFNNWSISANSEYLNRQCTEITGTPSESYQQKGIFSFKLWIDTQTGILLKYEGYAQDGSIAEYTTTENISIDNQLNIKQYNSNQYMNYTQSNY